MPKKQSRLNKKERTKEKTLHELLMQCFEEEQRQRELEKKMNDVIESVIDFALQPF